MMEAKTLFEKTLLKNIHDIPDLTNIPLEKTGLLCPVVKELMFTHFNDPYDTLIYSNLIGKALELNPKVKEIIDLGAGSSIPTLLALKKSGRRDVEIYGYDIDPEAKHVGESNAEQLGLSDFFHFQSMKLEEALSSRPVTQASLIVSNPPYVATPREIQHDEHFIPINGGVHGEEYLMEILERPYPPGTTLALLWGSLTSPHEILSLMEEKFELLHSEAYRIHFGDYTNNPVMKEHLYRLRDEGKIYFENDPQKGEVQLIFGTILKRHGLVI